ncbi:MAG: type II secretion system protein GspG [Polyangiaceae bacterium]|nr:type II secretion system protein GspG [Polyangiaceae bacterium]
MRWHKTRIKRVAIVVTLAAVGQGASNPWQSANLDMSRLEVSIDLFAIVNDRYPRSLDEVGIGSLVDPWGAPYVYFRIPTGYEIWSCGPDGLPGTEDDIYPREHWGTQSGRTPASVGLGLSDFGGCRSAGLDSLRWFR